MAVLSIGTPFPYGTRVDGTPMPRLVNLPAGVLRYRIRERHNDITTIVLKFSDRFERHYLELTPEGDWQPMGYPIGTNSTNNQLSGPRLKYEEIKAGDHCWALLDGKLVIVLKDVEGSCFVAGPWECGIPSDRLELLEIIPRPEQHGGTELYYL